MTDLVLRRCSEPDRRAIHRIRSDVEAWLSQRGYTTQSDPRWSARAHDAIDALLDSKRFIGLYAEDTPVAVAALSTPDMDFWRPSDNLNDAWYIARMMTAHHGAGHGSHLLNALAAGAAANGRRHLRLDCLRTNEQLHAYYIRNGFRLIRVAAVVSRRSGALFERPVHDLLPQQWDH